MSTYIEPSAHKYQQNDDQKPKGIANEVDEALKRCFATVLALEH